MQGLQNKKINYIIQILVFVVINYLVLTQSLLACNNVSAQQVKRDFINRQNLSPALGIDVDDFRAASKNLYDFTISTPHKISSAGILYNPISSSYFQQVAELSNKFITDLNENVLKDYRFDNNAIFYKKYSSNNPEETQYNELDDTDYFKGGNCAGLALILQKRIYDSIRSKEFIKAVFPGFEGRIEVIKELDEDSYYHLKVMIGRAEYHIKGYITGIISADPRLTFHESRLLEFVHFNAMTKIIGPRDEKIAIICDPGLSLPKGINNREEVEIADFMYTLENTTLKSISKEIDSFSNLSWMKTTKKGQKIIKDLEKKGKFIVIRKGENFSWRILLLDSPLDKEQIRNFSDLFLKIPFFKYQKIARRTRSGNLVASAHIVFKSEKEITQNIEKYGENIKSEHKSPVFMRLFWMDKGKRKRMSLSYDELLQIKQEIEYKNPHNYSEYTKIFLLTGNSIGLVTKDQLGPDAYNSEFFKRLNVLLNKRARNHYLETIEEEMQNLKLEDFGNSLELETRKLLIEGLFLKSIEQAI